MVSPDDPLSGVLWIGGGSGAGKSTMATRLGADHGLAVFHTDDELSADAGGRLSSDEA